MLSSKYRVLLNMKIELSPVPTSTDPTAWYEKLPGGAGGVGVGGVREHCPDWPFPRGCTLHFPSSTLTCPLSAVHLTTGAVPLLGTYTVQSLFGTRAAVELKIPSVDCKSMAGGVGCTRRFCQRAGRGLQVVGACRVHRRSSQAQQTNNQVVTCRSTMHGLYFLFKLESMI